MATQEASAPFVAPKSGSIDEPDEELLPTYEQSSLGSLPEATASPEQVRAFLKHQLIPSASSPPNMPKELQPNGPWAVVATCPPIRP